MVDHKDQIIINELEQNGRVSYVKLGKVLGVSEAAIRKRIKKLEDNEIIIGYKAKINYQKLGYKNKIIMGIDTTPQDYFKVIEKLKSLDYVKDLTTSSGDHMIIFDMWVRSLDHLKEVLDQVNAIEGVTKTCPSILQEPVN